MIETIKVRDFKSLVNVEVELGTVNVFIGANGSGKSNLLEAIGILGAAASGLVNDESLKYRGVRPGLPVLYKSSFKKKRGAMHISLKRTVPKHPITFPFGIRSKSPIVTGNTSTNRLSAIAGSWLAVRRVQASD